jgi:hypothetical protein
MYGISCSLVIEEKKDRRTLGSDRDRRPVYWGLYKDTSPFGSVRRNCGTIAQSGSRQLLTVWPADRSSLDE